MAGQPLHSWYGFAVGTPYYTTNANVTTTNWAATIDSNGNITAPYANITNLTATTAQFDTASANNFTVSGNLTVSGNIVGNVTGKLQSPGADTWVLYTIGGNASSSANFTFNPSINFLHLSGGNLCVDDGDPVGSVYGNTSGNVLTVANISPGLQLYVGSKLIGPGLSSSNTTIAYFGTGNGGVGTYFLSSNVDVGYSNTAFTVTNNVANSGAGQIVAKYYWGDGSNITNVSALYANTVLSSAQPNITSVGNLTGLSVSNIANVKLPGGNTNQVLISTGNGGVAWSNTAQISNGISNGTSSVTIPSLNGPVTISSNNTSNIVVVNGPFTGTNVNNNYPNVVINGELWVNGNVRANYFDGDGSRLANINAGNIRGNMMYSGSFLVAGRTLATDKTITISSGKFNIGTRAGNLVIEG